MVQIKKLFLVKKLGAAPPYEDFTTFTVVEPDDRIQLTEYHIDILAYRNEDSYVYKSYGVDHFGNFTHDVDVEVEATAQDNWQFACWMLSNAIDDAINAKPNIHLCVSWDTGDVVAFALYEIESDGTPHNSSWVSSLSFDTTYYIRIVKGGTSLVAGIYSTAELRDAGDGTDGDVGNVSLTLTTDYSMQYCYGVASRNVGDMDAPVNGNVDNLNLNE